MAPIQLEIGSVVGIAVIFEVQVGLVIRCNCNAGLKAWR